MENIQILQPQAATAMPKNFSALFGKFFVFGGVLLLFTAALFFLQERNLILAKASETKDFVVTGDVSRAIFTRSENSFSLDTARAISEVSFTFFGEDELRVLPGSKLEGAIFPGDTPRVLVRLKEGKLFALRLSSFPLISIVVDSRVIFPGEGIIRVSKEEPQITPLQYPVMVGSFIKPVSLKQWISPVSEGISLSLFPEANVEEVRLFTPILKQADEIVKQKMLTEEKQSFAKGFHFRKVPGITLWSAKFIQAVSNAFSLRTENDQRNREKFAEKLIDDSLFAIVLRDPAEAKKRIEAAFSVSPKFPLRLTQRFASVAFDHPFRLLDQELRDRAKSFEPDLALLAFLQGLYEYFDFQRLGFSINEQRGALIVFGETLKQSSESALAKAMLPLFEKFFASLVSDPRYFDAMFLKMVVGLQDQIAAGDFYDQREQWFALGRSFLENGRISLAIGREALLLLLGESGERREKLIADQSRLISFLFSSEAAVAERTYREQFAAFVEREEEAQKIRSIVGEDANEVRSAADVFATLIDDFKGVGIQIKEVVPSETEAGILMIKRAVFADISFNGIYDGIQKIFLSLDIGDESYERSVSLANFSSFFSAVTGKKQDKPQPSEELRQKPEDTQQSKLERVAKAKALEKLTLLGIEVKEDDLTVKNIEELLLEIANAKLTSVTGNSVQISFEFFTNTNEARNVEIPSAVGSLKIVEKFPISMLKERVELLLKRAELEKKAEEEQESDERSPDIL